METFFEKVAGLGLRYRCFLVNVAKFLKPLSRKCHNPNRQLNVQS